MRQEERRGCLGSEQLAHVRQTCRGPAQYTHTSRFSFACFSFSAFFAAFSMFSFLLMSHHLAAGQDINAQPRVAGLDHPLDSGELSRLLCFALYRSAWRSEAYCEQLAILCFDTVNCSS